MRYQDLLELKKRMDFKLTEPEVLIKLVEEARSKGEKAQIDMKRLRELSFKIAEIFKNEGLIIGGRDLNQVRLRHERAVGIDGSFQLTGGAGGKWYAPISVARIIFENGFGSQPYVDIWAEIEEIDEINYPNPENIASLIMLTAESKAILNWGTLNKPSFVFIDGPIVDPPVINIGGEEYIKYRCEGIKNCLEQSIVIGCVKRSRDRFYIHYLENLLSDTSAKSHLSEFLTDQHLMAYIFAYVRTRKYVEPNEPIFTKWIDISSVNETYEVYKKHGIYIVCLFFQKSVTSPVLRLDIPLLNPLEDNPKMDETVLQAVKATDIWTYPGQDYPLPVILAHEKCNIREGCAQVLYEEIITKSRLVDPYNQLILTQLR